MSSQGKIERFWGDFILDSYIINKYNKVRSKSSHCPFGQGADMSLKKQNRLTPVMMNELVGGQTYIRIGVDMYGGMSFSTLVFSGRPFKSSSSFCSWWMKSTSSVLGMVSLGDAGVVPDKQYNQHRLFRYTEKNKAALKKLVNRQALAEYHTLIGAGQSHTREEPRILQSFPAFFDDDFEDFDEGDESDVNEWYSDHLDR